MPPPQSIQDLVTRFSAHIDDYKRATYNETQLRREFLDPFFAALGWDVHNEKGYAEAYKDVVHEDAIKVGGTTRAPDYSFRIGRERKFFVEAKKPSVDVKGDPHPAYQLRRYAWSAKLPVSIVTDFEEFAVYDCRIRPNKKDKSSTARLLYLTFDEYESRWDEIAGIFAREAILKGAFDKYAQKKKRTRGTAEVDDEFLKEMERWRSSLAQHIARNNDLTARQINYAVQLIIDRIVFLRICEDRGAEQAGTLQALLNGDHVYDRLFLRFRHADAKYNSGLFHFEQEPGRPDPDTLTPSLRISDTVLKDIRRHLYYPDSPYEFSVLPADILGQVYERFLGSIITLSKTGKTAQIEEKPEVRKAGGVYYTPTYIVDYIVEHTVGELLKDRSLTPKGRGKSRRPVMNTPLRVLDPACGSGSFLIGAYQYLLDWHLKCYLGDDRDDWARLASPPITERASDWVLTTHERKRILTELIFGVDIDAQAVEVSKLSLLLKVLEGENEQTLQPLLFARERALPDLSSNIKCGNSLIGSDFYDNEQATIFDDEQRYQINAFDWKAEFRQIMDDGGFDAVIGNPPYFNVDDSWGKGDDRQRYLKRRYKNIYNDKTDILFYFLGRACELSLGKIGMIVSRAFLEAYKADKLRNYLASTGSVEEITDFRNYHVFPGIGITTMIIILDSKIQERAASFRRLIFNLPETISAEVVRASDYFELVDVPHARLTSSPWIFARAHTESIYEKIDNAGDTIDQLLHIGQGMQTGRNSVFAGLPPEVIKEWGLSAGQFFFRVRNSDIHRYHIKNSGRIVVYPEAFAGLEDMPN